MYDKHELIGAQGCIGLRGRVGLIYAELVNDVKMINDAAIEGILKKIREHLRSTSQSLLTFSK